MCCLAGRGQGGRRQEGSTTSKSREEAGGGRQKDGTMPLHNKATVRAFRVTCAPLCVPCMWCCTCPDALRQVREACKLQPEEEMKRQ